MPKVLYQTLLKRGYLTASAVGKLTGLTKKQLFYLENLPYPLVRPRRASNGYRLYAPEEVARIRAVVDLRRQGYSLKEICQNLIMPVILAGKKGIKASREINERAREATRILEQRGAETLLEWARKQ